MSLYAALYIANSLAKRYKLKNSLIGASAILVHLLLSVTVTEDGTWMVTYLAAEGLFTAIISAIFAVEITRFCDKNHLTIKMPDGVPPMVADSFSILIPLIIEVLVATGVATLCQNIAGMVFPQVIMKVLAPAIASMDSLPMVMLVVFLTQLLWMFGLHRRMRSRPAYGRLLQLQMLRRMLLQ